MYAISSQKRVSVRKVVEDKVPTGLDLLRGGMSIARCAEVGMIAVDIDPVEKVVLKRGKHVVRSSVVYRDASIITNRQSNLRAIKINQVQFLRVTRVQNMLRKEAKLGANLYQTRAT